MLHLLLLIGGARAASYDPDLDWMTLSTEHFNITFHEGEEALAEEFSAAAEGAWAKMTKEIQHWPGRPVEVVLVDHTDSANGYAMTLPVNTVVIFVTAPSDSSSLSTYEDWNDAIFTHELTHILHLDTAEGLPLALRYVVGRIIAVNQISPGWMVEGYATMQETRHTNGGRGRSTVADMIKRMAVLEDDFPPLGNMDGWQTDPPGGNLRYLFGQDFQQYIADTHGRDVWTDWIHVYGGWIPYLLPSQRVMGDRFLPMYREWEQHLVERYERQEAQVDAVGRTPYRILSDGEDSCAGPTWTPSGDDIVWSCSDPRTGSDIFLAGPMADDPQVELPGRFASDFTWRTDGKAFAFSQDHLVARYNAWSDIVFHEVGRGTDAMTNGKRARDPSFSPDGHELVVVRNDVQNNELARMTVDRQLKTLADYDDHTQLYTPVFSPDGRYLAMSVWREGQRDLWLVTADGEPYRRLTVDKAIDGDPAWSHDGDLLYFTSDRTGIFNIYAIDLAAERLFQVTNVVGGAFHPAPKPDGTALVFESFSTNGVDIAWMDLDRSKWWDRGALPLPLEHRGSLAEILPAGPVGPELYQPDYSLDEGEVDLDDPPDSGPAEGQQADETEDGGSDLTPAHRKHRSWELPPNRGMPGFLADTAPLPGIEGLGSPYHFLSHLPGPWGLPGEDPAAGEPDLEYRPPSRADDDELLWSDDGEETEGDDEGVDTTYPFSHPLKDYNPWPTLLPPRYVFPGIYRTSYGFMGLLATSSVDTLRRYAYSAYVSYRTDSKYTGWGASIAHNRFEPLFTAGVYTRTTPYGDIYRYPQPDEGGAWIPSVQTTNERYWDKRMVAYLQATKARGTNQAVFARYSGTLREPLDELPDDVYAPYLPTRGFLSAVAGGWRLARGKAYSKSISPEDARVLSLVGEVTSPLLGSYYYDDDGAVQPFAQLQATAEWREYRSVPWMPNHVIAWKLAGGATSGDTTRYGSFRLGGDYGESSYYTLPDEWRALRGFPVATVSGDWFYLGSAEYRLPIAWVDRGFGTIPAFGRYLSAAAFVDFGNAFDGLPAGRNESLDLLASTLVGTGAELRGSAIIGWGIPVTARAGYAFGLNGSDGYSLGAPDGAYVWLGTSF